MRTAITVRGFHVFGYHGLFEEERRLGQAFVFDIRAELAETRTHQADDLTQTVRYDQLLEVAIRSNSIVHRSLEALAETIGRDLLAHFDAIQTISIAVSKRSPPVRHHMAAATAEVVLDRAELNRS